MKYGPKIVTDGLVLCLDANDAKFSKNLAFNSEDLNLWSNNGSAISISSNAEVAPDGAQTADTLSQTSATAAARWLSSVNSFTYINGITYTISIWLKKISGNDPQPVIYLWSNISGGAYSSVGTLTTEWVRYSATFTATQTYGSNTFTGLNIAGWNSNGAANDFVFAAWGFQLEIGNAATDYEPSIKPTWKDLSGYGNHASVYSSQPVLNIDGGVKSFSFTGSGSNRFTMSNNTALDTQTPSVEVWIKTNYTSQNGFWFEKGAVNSQYSLFQEGSNIVWRQKLDNGLKSMYLTSSQIDTSNWFNIVGTYTSGDRRLYINGNLVNSDTQTGVISTSSGMYIGAYGPPYGYYYNGYISVVKVYNRALSAAEIKQNYNTTKTRFGY